MRRLGLLIAPVLLVSLVGCGAFGPTPIQPDPVETGAAAEETPTPSAVPYPEAPDGVVATGNFESSAVATSGVITITKRGDKFILKLDDFDTDFDGQMSFVLSDIPVTATMCGEGGHYQIARSLSGTTIVPALTVREVTDDPSFLTTASVIQDPVGATINDCTSAFLGTATLDWTLPDLRPVLVLEDSGSRAGAHGVITKDGDYLTTSGDVWGEVAARFGITPDELEWLNPIRPTRKKGVAYDDEVLNLSKSQRGDSQRRIGYVYDGEIGSLPTQ